MSKPTILMDIGHSTVQGDELRGVYTRRVRDIPGVSSKI